MNRDSIRAYELAERVQRYDADMNIMHPLRWKMIEVVLEVPGFETDRALAVLDLGAGTGLLTKRVLETFPHAHVVAVDGAAQMVELAQTRLGDQADHVEFVVSDFRALPDSVLKLRKYDLIASVHALHHLSAGEKRQLLRPLIATLAPDGWFLNADIVVASTEVMERRFQALRVEGIVSRAPAGDTRFAGPARARRYLDDMEAREQDQPIPLGEDVAILRECGLDTAEVIWRDYREAVTGGRKTR